MEVQCRACRRGVLFPTSTIIYRCYDCQRVITSLPNGEAKVTCRGCGGKFIVPINTTAYRCSICQAVSTSISGYRQPSEDDGIHSRMRKIGAKLFKHEVLERSNKNASMRDHRSPSSSTGSSSSCRSNKRAVLCGVTYQKKKFRLKGTVNDVLNMREMLIKIFEFPTECIRVLTGHGLQQPDLKEDERDGFDETLCPVDFLREGTIIDNDLNSIIVWPLKMGVTLHAIIDACHSGTILDLTYVYKLDQDRWEDNSPPAKEPIRKRTSGGLAICFSACEDNQMAADTTAFSRKGMNGVMTYLFIKTIKSFPEITYGGILEKMHVEIEKISQNKCHPSILQQVFWHKIAQDPIISSSEKFDVFKRKFIL